LPGGQQRILDGIENVLEGGEPRLRAMFAIFTRLTRDEGAPRTEALREQTTLLRRAWPAGGTAATVRAIIAVPLILGLMALFIFMAISGSGAQSCRPGPAATRTMSCQSAQEPAGHS
jgi:hypothetical protein